MIEVKDRVPSQVLTNGAIRYEEFDAEGNSLGYKYIKRADEPTEAGTPINKVLFDKLQNYGAMVDRYKSTTLGYSTSQDQLYYDTDNILPTAWSVSSDEKTISANGITISTDKYSNLKNIANGNEANYAKCGGSGGNIYIDAGTQMKILQIKILADNDSYLSIYAKATASEAYPQYYIVKIPAATEVTETIVDIETPMRFIKIFTPNTCKIYNIEVIGYISKAQTIKYEAPVTTYETLKVVNIRTPNSLKPALKPCFKLNSLTEVVIDGYIEPSQNYTLLYDDTKGVGIMKVINNSNKEIVNYISGASYETSASLTIAAIELQEEKIYRMYFNNSNTTDNLATNAKFNISVCGQVIASMSCFDCWGVIDFFMSKGHIHAFGNAWGGSYVDYTTEFKAKLAYTKSNFYLITLTMSNGDKIGNVINDKTFVKLFELRGDTI